MAEPIYSNGFFTDNSNDSPDGGNSNNTNSMDPLMGNETDITLSSKDDHDGISPDRFDMNTSSPLSDGIVPKLCLSDSNEDSFEHCNIRVSYRQQAYQEWIAGKK